MSFPLISRFRPISLGLLLPSVILSIFRYLISYSISSAIIQNHLSYANLVISTVVTAVRLRLQVEPPQIGTAAPYPFNLASITDTYNPGFSQIPSLIPALRE